jgi:hypothetical protein
MLKFFKCLYYKRLFFKIYFCYLKGSDPKNAINDAYDDIQCIKRVMESIREHG